MEQRTEAWYEARRGKLTASRIGRLLDGGPTTVAALMDTIQREIEAGPGGWLEGRDADSAAMAHGREYEDRAIALYEMIYSAETVKVGFIEHPTLRGVGASCDRIQLLNHERHATVEVKCPINPDMHRATLTYGMPPEHAPQVQTQLFCTGLPTGYFLSFNDTFAPPSRQLYVQQIMPDLEYHARIRERVEWFWRLFDRGERPSADISGIPQLF